ncbi:UNVERIFIED_CONTAM: hypothetical protein GTU68_019788, partial [Idotea baltica]|nr:hypothetical protein [Idotea baltica]
MFERAPLNPPDAIFGLIETFKKDSNPNKINLSVGVYQNETGVTPVMDAVYEAEKKLLADRGTKSYLPIDGSPRYCEAIGRLILGDNLFDADNVHSCTAQTPGGTVSLRLSGELLRRVFGVNTIWMSDPTWANHTKIFSTAGLGIKKYDYLDDAGTGIGFDKVLASLASAEAGEAILLHAVCHNPTGVDPTPEQWEQLFKVVCDKGLIPVFDFAYQGFGESIETDAAPIRRFVANGNEAIVCNSFSKNFGLYGERVGGITAVSKTAESSTAMLSQIKLMIRTMYSNPPLHGASIVDTVLNDADLRSRWETELAGIRERIIQLRSD